MAHDMSGAAGPDQLDQEIDSFLEDLDDTDEVHTVLRTEHAQPNRPVEGTAVPQVEGAPSDFSGSETVERAASRTESERSGQTRHLQYKGFHYYNTPQAPRAPRAGGQRAEPKSNAEESKGKTKSATDTVKSAPKLEGLVQYGQFKGFHYNIPQHPVSISNVPPAEASSTCSLS
jgi:hypothetical protein